MTLSVGSKIFGPGQKCGPDVSSLVLSFLSGEEISKLAVALLYRDNQGKAHSFFTDNEKILLQARKGLTYKGWRERTAQIEEMGKRKLISRIDLAKCPISNEELGEMLTICDQKNNRSSRVPNLESLSLSECPNLNLGAEAGLLKPVLSVLNYTPKLRQLKVNECSRRPIELASNWILIAKLPLLIDLDIDMSSLGLGYHQAMDCMISANKLKCLKIKFPTQQVLLEIAKMSNLEELVLTGESGYTLSYSCLKDLKKLRKFSAHACWCIGKDLVYLTPHWGKLENLDFSANNLTDSKCVCLKKLTQLVSLNVSIKQYDGDGHLTDKTIKEVISQLPCLRHLDINRQSHILMSNQEIGKLCPSLKTIKRDNKIWEAPFTNKDSTTETFRTTENKSLIIPILGLAVIAFVGWLVYNRRLRN